MRGFAGKVTIVSGASRGMGKSIALWLAGDGVSIHITAEAMTTELAASRQDCAAAVNYNAKVECGTFNLQHEGTTEQMVSGAVNAFGGVNILVNDAGIRGARALGDFTYEEFNGVVAVSLRAPFFAVQAVIPSIKSNGGGRIMLTSSQHGIGASYERSLYGAAKAALACLARAMAYELSAHNILVNAIGPGPIASEAYLRQAAANPDTARRLLSYLPVGRVGHSKEVAARWHFSPPTRRPSSRARTWWTAATSSNESSEAMHRDEKT